MVEENGLPVQNWKALKVVLDLTTSKDLHEEEDSTWPLPRDILTPGIRQVAFDTMIESVQTIKSWTPDEIEAQKGVLLNHLYEVVYLYVKHSPDPVIFYFDFAGQDEVAMDKSDASLWIREL
jgi:hypothetical protein